MASTSNPLGGGATAAAPGRLCDPQLFTLGWGDMMYERDYAQRMHYIRMPQEQWERGAAGHLAAHPHNWTVHQWIARTHAARAEYQQRASQRVVVEMPDAAELEFRVWKDMIEEPYKYGDDIVEWLDLDAKVMAGPKRWRAGAFWQVKEDEEAVKEAMRKVEEEQARRNELATRIQALWRGYSTRCKQVWRDCAHCLKHGICVEQVEGEHVCRCCWGEANPVEDDVVTPVEDRDLWGPNT